ncbi:MAG: PAS domain-containing protein [Verrucomicrobiota bacterium JB023]|nr:PAS domain-containing protein [Verrucomicrobiota bacterium JB023]
MVYRSLAAGSIENGKELFEVSTANGTKKLWAIAPSPTLASAKVIAFKQLLDSQEKWLQSLKRIEFLKMFKSTMYDSSPDGIVLLDPLGRIYDVNRTFVRLCGRPMSELLTSRISHLIPRQYLRGAILAMKKAVETGESYYEGELQSPTKSMIPVSITSSMIKLSGASFALCVVRDLRRFQRRAERTIDYELSMASAIEKASDSFIIVDESLVIRKINPAFSRLMGCPGDRLIGKDFGDTLDVSSMKSFRLHLRHVLRNGYAKFQALLLLANRETVEVNIIIMRFSSNDNFAYRIFIEELRPLLAQFKKKRKAT